MCSMTMKLLITNIHCWLAGLMLLLYDITAIVVRSQDGIAYQPLSVYRAKDHCEFLEMDVFNGSTNLILSL